jgi:hypothetical protein
VVINTGHACYLAGPPRNPTLAPSGESKSMAKSEQLTEAYMKLEEAGKLLRDAGEDLLAQEADQLAISVDLQATSYAIVG